MNKRIVLVLVVFAMLLIGCDFEYYFTTSSTTQSTSSITTTKSDSDVVPEHASKGLEYFFVEDENCYYVSGIGECTDTNIVLPEKYKGYAVKGVRGEAFSALTYITGIDIPDTVEVIGPAAFVGCEITEIVIPDSVTTIYDGAFAYCTKLKNVILGENVTYIGESAFFNSGIEKITIPKSMTTIGTAAFYACPELTEVVFLGEVEIIEAMAFSICPKLETISLTSSIQRIGSKAFAFCEGLKAIKFEGTMEQWENIPKSEDWNVMLSGNTITIYCLDGNLPKQ